MAVRGLQMAQLHLASPLPPRAQRVGAEVRRVVREHGQPEPAGQAGSVRRRALVAGLPRALLPPLQARPVPV